MKLRKIMMLLLLALAIAIPSAVRAAEDKSKDSLQQALDGPIDWSLLEGWLEGDMPGMPSWDLAGALGDNDVLEGIFGFSNTPLDPVIGQAAAGSCAAELAALPPVMTSRADEFLSAVPTSGAGTTASAAPAQVRRYGKFVVDPSANKGSAAASADDDAEVGVDEKCSDVAVPKKRRARAAAASVANECPICSQSFRSLRALQQHAGECDAFGDHAEVSASGAVALPVSALVSATGASAAADETAITEQKVVLTEVVLKRLSGRAPDSRELRGDELEKVTVQDFSGIGVSSAVPATGRPVKGLKRVVIIDDDDDEDDDTAGSGGNEQASLSSAALHKVHLEEDRTVKHVCHCGYKTNALRCFSRHQKMHKGVCEYVCTVCNISFNKLIGLSAHMQMRHPEEAEGDECDVCHLKINSLAGRNQHKKVHEGYCPYHCSLCDARFNKLRALFWHKKFCRGSVTASADVDEKCSDVAVPQKRRARAAADSIANECPICLQSFRSLRALQQHAGACDAFGDHAEVGASGAVALPVSALVSATGASAAADETAITEQKVVPTEVVLKRLSGRVPDSRELCGYELKKATAQDFSGIGVSSAVPATGRPVSGLKRAVIIDEDDDEDDSSEYDTAANGGGHERAGLSRAQQFLALHASTVVAPGARQYVCTVCGNKSRESWHLALHMRMHEGECPHVCEVCTAPFNKEYGLNLHMRQMHPEKRDAARFVCDNCGAAAGGKYALDQHKQCHQGKCPYGCNMCKASFNTRIMLTRHLHWAHLEEDSIVEQKCHVCGYKTGRSANFKAHMKMHKGNCPHVCIDCSAAFNDPYALGAHKKRCSGKAK